MISVSAAMLFPWEDSLENRILALDFDGVICDSLPECFVSGFLASQGPWTGEAAKALAAACRDGSDQYRKFCLWRPFVRSGEDYVLIARLMARGEAFPESQEEMDAHLRAAGPSVMAECKKTIYTVREWLLREFPDLWLELNPLMAPLAPYLHDLSEREDAWILSTKKPRFIGLILQHHGVSWPAERVLEASGEAKIKVMDRNWGEDRKVLFLDDQPDHFLNLPGRIQCLLPTWGYVRQSWLDSPQGYGVLSAEGVEELLQEWRG